MKRMWVKWEKRARFINSENLIKSESLPFEKLSSKHHNWVLEFYRKPPKNIILLETLSTYRFLENNKQGKLAELHAYTVPICLVHHDWKVEETNFWR